jgi:DNA invertase Pin-like site-specific DNA recombinase
MGNTFAIYLRASEEDGDGFSSSPEEQEAEALGWANRVGVEVEDEPVFEVASGGLAAKDRLLGQLIERCERGELAGIIVRDLNRFARDVVAGGAALARLKECGARLVATRNGFDSESLTPETQMLFNIMMSVGQAERERNRLRRQFGKDKAAERGVWCASVPVGYDRDEEGKLQPNEDAEVVKRIFTLRAEGHGFTDIADRLPEVWVRGGGGQSSKGVKAIRRRDSLGRGSVKHVVANRAYLGEQRVPNGKKGEPKVIRSSHRPIVTEAEWEAANAVKGHGPRRTGLGVRVAGLLGLVRCGGCGRRLFVMSESNPRYVCTARDCPSRGSLGVYKLENAVDDALAAAFKADRLEVLAVASHGQRHVDAIAQIEAANRALAEYRDSTELQSVLGMADWTEGLKVRREAVDVARRALSALGPQPKPVTDMRRLLKESSRPYIAEVKLYGRSAPARLTVRWVGAADEDVIIGNPVEEAA